MVLSCLDKSCRNFKSEVELSVLSGKMANIYYWKTMNYKTV